MYVSKKLLKKVGKAGFYFLYAVAGGIITYVGYQIASAGITATVNELSGESKT